MNANEQWIAINGVWKTFEDGLITEVDAFDAITLLAAEASAAFRAKEGSDPVFTTKVGG